MSQRGRYKTPAEILEQLMVDDDDDGLPEIPVSDDEEEEEDIQARVYISVQKPQPPPPPTQWIKSGTGQTRDGLAFLDVKSQSPIM
jgi:hypothetical protein